MIIILVTNIPKFIIYKGCDKDEFETKQTTQATKAKTDNNYKASKRTRITIYSHVTEKKPPQIFFMANENKEKM